MNYSEDEEDVELPELEEIRCDYCHKMFEGQSDEFICAKCVDREYPDRRDLCPRGGCIFCQGPRGQDATRTIAELSRQMMQEMEDARTNPAKVEEKRNREVWPYPQLPVKYEEYLESDFWRHIRKRVIRLADCDGEGCGKCSISQHECRERYGKGYQVHHKTYTRLGNEHPDDLVALCPACHAKEHGLPEPARKS